MCSALSVRSPQLRSQAAAEVSAPEQLVPSIMTLIASIERHGPTASATIAFRAALARRGRELVEAGGWAALADVLIRIFADDPKRADAREDIVAAAWAGLAAPAA